MSSKLIWLTDLHLLPAGENLNRCIPAKRLDIALDYIQEHHSDLAYCIVSGDLTDRGNVECYQHMHRRFTEAGISYLPLAGNHDERQTLREQLALPADTHSEFVQYAVRVGSYRIIALDTLSQGKSEGFLCEERMQWLTHELANDSTTPTLVFCHHPPKVMQMPMLDPVRLSNGEALLELLRAYDCVKHLCFGHIHRPVSGTFGNLGFTAMRAASIQVPLPYPPWNWDNFDAVPEAPALGIVSLMDDSILIHSHAFCDASDGLID